MFKDMQELEKGSYVVRNDGKLYHKALLGLELNKIYESYTKELMFGYESE